MTEATSEYLNQPKRSFSGALKCREGRRLAHLRGVIGALQDREIYRVYIRWDDGEVTSHEDTYTDLSELCADLFEGQIGHAGVTVPLWVEKVCVAEGSARDISAEVAAEWLKRLEAENGQCADNLNDFILIHHDDAERLLAIRTGAEASDAAEAHALDVSIQNKRGRA